MNRMLRKALAGLLALVLVPALAPTLTVRADVFSSPQATEWESGSIKVKRQGLGPAPGTRQADPLGRSGILQEPGSACFETWNYSWNDLYWHFDPDPEKAAPQAWTTRAYGQQDRMTFL